MEIYSESQKEMPNIKWETARELMEFFSELSKFRESEKSLKHELVSFKDPLYNLSLWC